MKILVLYYSGVGNTKMVAKKIYNTLLESYDVTLLSIEKIQTKLVLSDYDGIVIGFPTIHSSPAEPMLDFIKEMKEIGKSIPTYLFTTCGLYSANALRIFAMQCISKGLIPIISRSYRCAATDGILIAPSMKIWFHHEKGLNKKIENDISNFLALLSKPIEANIPRFKLYSILNYPNKILGQHFSPKIYVHKQKCVLCGKCIENCPSRSISKNNEGFPMIEVAQCIHCYRCIHHCPQIALSLSQKRTPLKTLYYTQTK
ncbi:MAG: EFR1 family ferrodoxin [Filifactoraceae bacterium]